MFSTKPYLVTRRPSPTTAEFIVSTHPPPTLALRAAAALGHLLRVLASLSALLVLLSLWTLSPYFPYSPSSSSSSSPGLQAYRDATSNAVLPPPLPPTVDGSRHGGGGGFDGSFRPYSSPSAEVDFLLDILSHIQYHTLPGRLALQLASASYASLDRSSSSSSPALAAAAASAAITNAPYNNNNNNRTAISSSSLADDDAPLLLPTITAAPPPFLLILLSLLAIYLSLLRPHVEERLLVLRGLGIQTSTSSRYWFLGPSTRFLPTEKIQDVLVNEAFWRAGFAVRHYLVIVVEGEDEVVVVFPALVPRRRVVERVWRGTRGCLYDEGGGGGGGGGGVGVYYHQQKDGGNGDAGNEKMGTGELLN